MRLIKKIMFLFVIVSVMSGCDFKTNGNNQESKNINDLSFSSSEISSFVKYEDYVYYWNMNDNSREEIGLYGEYNDKPNVKNELIRLDNSLNKKVVINDYGNGDILVLNNKIYLQSLTDDNNHKKIYSVNLDGNNKVEYFEGIIKNVIDNYVICNDYNNNILAINSSNNEIKVLKENASVIGIINNKIYYSTYDSKNIELSIGYILDKVDQGVITKVKQELFDSKPTKLEVENFFERDNKIYTYVGYKSGSAGLFDELIQLIINSDNSVVSMKNIDITSGYEGKSDLYLEYLNGLKYHDKNGNIHLIIDSNELTDKYGIIDDDEHNINIVSYAFIDNYIFGVIDNGVHYPEGDIGDRSKAYKKIKTIIFRYDIKNNNFDILSE